MFESIAGGIKLQKWCELAEAQGIKTKCGGKWASDMASCMCRDTRFIGQGYYNKKGNGEPIPMKYPRIISDELFAKVQLRLAENRRKSSGTSKRTYMLSKLGKCGACDAPLACRTSKGYGYILCTKQQDKHHIHQCYKPAYWRLKPIKELVWTEENTLDNYRDGVNGVLLDNFERAKAGSSDRITRVEEGLRDVQNSIQQLVNQIATGTFDEKHIRAKMTHLKETEEHWNNELTNAKALQVDSEAIMNEFLDQLDNINRMYDWGGTWFLSDEQKKVIINALLERFTLEPTGEIEIRYKLPASEKQLQGVVASMLSINKGRGLGGID